MAEEQVDHRPGADAWGPTTTHRVPADGAVEPPTAVFAAEAAAENTGSATAEPVQLPVTAPAESTLRPMSTDELPLRQRISKKARRGEQLAAVRDAVSTLEAKLHPDFRVAIATGVLALLALGVQVGIGGVTDSRLSVRLISYGLALAFLALGIVAVRSGAGEIGRLSSAKGGPSASQVLRLTVLVVGYLLVALVTLNMVRVQLGNLVVGGALTGIVLGIAAQQSLGNVFAGLVLLFSRPYVPGERIRIAAGPLGGPHEGVVVNIGLVYTTLLTDNGPLNLPNSGLLASAIGPHAGQPAAGTPDPAAGQSEQPPGQPSDRSGDGR